MPHHEIPAPTLTAAYVPPPPRPPEPIPAPIAPWLHTAALISILVLTTTLTRVHAIALTVEDSTPRIYRYASTMLMEWLLLGAVIAGIYRRGPFLLTALRNRAATFLQSLGMGLVVFILGYVAIIFVGLSLYFTPFHRNVDPQVLLALAPHTILQFILWFAVSFTAGLCEEIIFRGYLLQQFTAWTGSPILAIILSAALFGSVHLYEGLSAIFALMALAVVYGFVVRYTKGDLRPVIVAHTLQDFMVGVLLLLRPVVEELARQHGIQAH